MDIFSAFSCPITKTYFSVKNLEASRYQMAQLNPQNSEKRIFLKRHLWRFPRLIDVLLIDPKMSHPKPQNIKEPADYFPEFLWLFNTEMFCENWCLIGHCSPILPFLPKPLLFTVRWPKKRQKKKDPQGETPHFLVGQGQHIVFLFSQVLRTGHSERKKWSNCWLQYSV